MAKLENDRNNDFFKAQNDGKLFQIEVDALNALRSEDFCFSISGNLPGCYSFFECLPHPEQSASSSSDQAWRPLCSSDEATMKRSFLIYN